MPKKAVHSHSVLHTDIAIVGGGMVGLTLAAALAPLGLSITIIEAQPESALTDTKYDGRTSAITYGSRLLFESLGVWESMAKDAGDILDIRIADNHSPFFLHYDHREVGSEPMGHIIENRHIRKALFTAVKKHRNVTLLCPMSCRDLALDSRHASVTLSNGKTLTATLILCAEGRNSKLRELADIATHSRDYGQTAIVCVAEHEKHHNGVAVEHFLPAGPFAILPMGGSKRSSLVWTERKERAPHYLAMKDEDFNAELQKRFGPFLGKVKIAGERWSYPVSLLYALSYTAPRFALVGDAAHAIHPIAGQGLNLGLKDVALLAELIAARAMLGLDIGNQEILKEYESSRRADSYMMIAATDGINRLFSNRRHSLSAARKLGLSAVQKLPPLKRAFMRHAMGTLGDVPALMKRKRS